MSPPATAGPDPLVVAIVKTCIYGKLAATDMKAALYLWLHGWVAPRYLDPAGKKHLAGDLDMNGEWLRLRLTKLLALGITTRTRGDDGFYHYALNPDYRFREGVP